MAAPRGRKTVHTTNPTPLLCRRCQDIPAARACVGAHCLTWQGTEFERLRSREPRGSGGFQFGDEPGKQGFLGKLRLKRNRRALRGGGRLRASLVNLRRQSLHIAMSRKVESEFAIGGVGDFGDVAGLWTDVKDRSTDAKDVVNLARMNQANERVA